LNSGVNPLKKVSELNWRTYLNENHGSAKFVVLYMKSDEIKASMAENPQLLARAILEAIAKKCTIYWAGSLREFKRINDL